MGLSDRDYYRTEPTAVRGPRASFKTWSMTTWLIVACAAIFVVDRTFLARFAQLVPTGESRVLQPELEDRAARIPKNDRIASPPLEVPGMRGTFDITTGMRTAEGIIPYRVDRYQRTPFLQAWLQFTTAQALMYPSPTRGLEGFEFWRFFGYQFLHADVTHLAFNMLGLYFFGPIVEMYLGRKRYLAFYLLCGLFGALVYMLLNVGAIGAGKLFPGMPVPGFLPYSPFMPLIGASACVYGVILAAAYLAPNETILLFFVLPMRLKTFAYTMVAVAVITVVTRGHNAGGEAAHLGGALAGAWFIRRPHHLHGFFDFLGRADPTSRSNRLRRAQRSGKHVDEAEVDRILDKIRTSGMGSLSEREREKLRDAARP